MVHNPVTKLGAEHLPQLGMSHAERLARTYLVGHLVKVFVQLIVVDYRLSLIADTIVGRSLMLAAVDIRLSNILDGDILLHDNLIVEYS